MTKIRCPECGNDNVRCIENGIKIKSGKFKEDANGDLFRCCKCEEIIFVTGIGYNIKK